MDQIWGDLLFLHWRVDPASVERWMPPGARPDVHDGSTWVGLIGFEMRRAGFGSGHPLPYLGDFAEINVRLYSTDDQGRRGVVFRSLETERLALVAATNPVGVNYRWARIRMERSAEGTGRIGYTSRRRTPPGVGAATDFAVRTTEEVVRDPLSVFLTARFGMHHRLGRRPLWVPNTHEPWPLRRAELLHCRDGLVAAAGLPGVTDDPPESVLWSPGVRTQFGRPRL
ncbi:YqjF family protein [Nocardioides aurantiacus]|uniref:YqjF family protein n=1 Tax=Nocardioides aurantiacus TaxID=86796 RepID=UPI000F4862E7|nr:DUF2071 domain-containing protein [Nocardioides aurantiacus]